MNNVQIKLSLFSILILIIIFLYYKLYKISINKMNKDIKNILPFTSVDTNIFQYLADDKDTIVIDIRTKPEILNTWVVYWTNKFLEFNMHFPIIIENLDKTKQYLLVCASWNRTWQAMRIMQMSWFKNVNDLDWWIMAWHSAGLSFVDWSFLFR